MARLPNRVKQKINVGDIWRKELKDQLTEVYYKAEEHDEILHSKLNILINNIDDLLSMQSDSFDYVSEDVLKKIKENEDEYKEEVFLPKLKEFDVKKQNVRTKISEIASVISRNNYNTEHLKKAPEEFKDMVRKIISPLDTFFEAIGYMKKEVKLEETPKRLPNNDKQNIKKKYEKEFQVNSEE